MVSLRRPGLEVTLRLVAVRSPAANGLIPRSPVGRESSTTVNAMLPGQEVGRNRVETHDRLDASLYSDFRLAAGMWMAVQGG